jgi:hypothetical protein
MLKVLIVQEPHLSNILNGHKTWEIRRQNTNIRGLIGLGRNEEMYGKAVLKDSFLMSVQDLMKHQDKHLVSPQWLKKYAKGKNNLFVWLLEKAERLEKPIKIPRSYGNWVLYDNKS